MSKTGPKNVLRILSYNIHGCRGADRKTDLQRIHDIIAETEADLIALQEVDGESRVGHTRSQSAIIADQLNMESVEFPVEETGRHRYGLAVLSRYRFAEARFLRLPNLYSRLKPRKRGAILATLESTWGPLRLINTHLSVFKMERRRQLAALLTNCRVAAASGDPPLIFCGDLNAGPSSHTYRTLLQHMTDTRQTSRAPEPQQGTFHARSPAFRIDHIFVSLHFTPLQSEVITTAETTIASDHLPLFADVALEVNRSGRRN